MARVEISSKKLRGNAGTDNYYVRLGSQIVRARATERVNPRTENQMTQRLKFGNCVNLWSKFNGAMLKGFITRTKWQTWYNAFVAINLQSEGVYLPKNYMEHSSSVVAPYYVSRGNLELIKTRLSYNEAFVISDVRVDRTVTSARELTLSILELNQQWQDGDKFCLFKCYQFFDDDDYPYAHIEFDSFTLNKWSSDPLPWWLEFGQLSSGGTYYLGIENETWANNLAGVAFVHTRKVRGKIVCSSQKILMISDYFENFTGEEALERAMASYNTGEPVFYDPQTKISEKDDFDITNWFIAQASSSSGIYVRITDSKSSAKFYLFPNFLYRFTIDGVKLDDIVAISFIDSDEDTYALTKGTSRVIGQVVWAFDAEGIGDEPVEIVEIRYTRTNGTVSSIILN